MNPFNKINDFFLLNKTKTQSPSPSSKQLDMLFQLPQQSSSDDTINTLSSSRTLPQTIQAAHQTPQSNHPTLPKGHGIPMKPIGFLKNGHNKDNSPVTAMKAKGPGIRFQKTGNLVSPGSFRSHEEPSSKPEGLNGGKNVQWNRDFKGTTEDIRINEETLRPIEPTNPIREVHKGAGGQYRELVEGENFLKVITEDRSKQEARGKFQIDFSDISETTSEVWRPNGTEIQQKKTEMESGASKFQENTKLVKKEVGQMKKQEIDGIRVINNNQGKVMGVIGMNDNGFMEQLKKFPLNELSMTKKGNFDKRYKLTQSYLDLCEKANQDPLRYYHDNCDKGQQVIVQSVKEDYWGNLLKKVNNDKDVLKELEEFSLEELVMTKKGLFDKRFKLTQSYFDLCEKANQDPLKYYHENRNKGQQAIVKNVQEDYWKNLLKEGNDEEEGNILEELEDFPLEELVMTKKGDFDKRYKLTQQYLELCENAGQDPLEYYHENME